MLQLSYGSVQGKADLSADDPEVQRAEQTDLLYESQVLKNLASYNPEIDQYLAGFLHRNDSATAPKTCSVRLRLTPSEPSKIGSVWFRDKVSIYAGFDTYFTFQITDQSKECTLHKNQYFATIHHRTCSVRGADGFAFVIHNDPANNNALGSDGGEMGFGGLQHSIAIAFDTWTNLGKELLFVDHISIQSRGPSQSNDAYDIGLLGQPRPHALADGKIHLVRISYFDSIIPEYLPYFVASPSLLPYLKDNGEQKRIGMLVVFIDDGVETNTPILSLPINLSLLLQLKDDQAVVGFTSATGRFFEKHDVLSWYFCDQQPCEATPNKKTFDYHQSSGFSAQPLRHFTGGSGYGGGDNTHGFPIENQSPDTSPWNMPLQHFAVGRNIGLSPVAVQEIPPASLY